MLTGMPSAKHCTMASKEKTGKKCATPIREMSVAVGVKKKKPCESSQGEKGRVL